MKRLIVCMLLVLLTAPVCHALIVVTPPGYGTNVVVRGTGAVANGYVEVFVNGVSKGSGKANASGDWNVGGLTLAAGDDVQAYASKVWNFNTDYDNEGWAGNPGSADVEVVGGVLKMYLLSGGDPFIQVNGLGLNSSQYRAVSFRVKNPSSMTAWQIYFDGSGNANGPGAPGNDKVSLTGNFQTEFQTVVNDMSFNIGDWAATPWPNNSNWVADGPINYFRIDFFHHVSGWDPADAGQVIEFDWIRIQESISWEFNDNGDFAYWKPNQDDMSTDIDLGTASVSGGKLNLDITGGDPNFNNGGPLGAVVDGRFDADWYQNFQMGGTWTLTTQPNKAEIFWIDNKATDGYAVNGNQANIEPLAGAGVYETVSTNIPTANGYAPPTWGGTDNPTELNGLRVDPVVGGTAGDKVAIDYIRLSPNVTSGPSAVVEVANTPGEKTPMVKNGSFEDQGVAAYPGYGPIMNWNSTGGQGVNNKSGPFWDNGYKMNGSQVAFKQGSGILSQDVDGFLAAPQQYTLRFLENLRNSSLDVDLVVRLGGNELVPLHRVPNGEFTAVAVDFTSPGAGMHTLEFEVLVNSGDGTCLLDGISITKKGEADPFPPATLPPRPNVIIANGSFEDEDLNPAWPHYGPVRWWTGFNGLNDNTGPFWDNGVGVHGKQVAFKQHSGIVSQLGIGFVAGQKYTLRFSENARNCCGPTPEDPVPSPGMSVRVNGVTLVAQHDVLTGGFYHYTVDFDSPGTGDYLLEFDITEPEGADTTTCLEAVSIVKKGDPNPYPVIPEDWPISVFRAATPPTIDGVVNVSTEYANSHVVDLRLSTLAAMDPYWPYQHDGSSFLATGTTTNDADLSALMYFLWDSQALYVAVVGTDEQLNPSPNPAVNGGDSFQLCLDYDQKNATDGQLEGTNVYIPSWALTDNVNDANWFQQFWPVANPNPFTGMTFNLKTNATGYVLETRIPWTAFTAGGDVYTKPFPPVDGQTCGVLPMLEDFDDGAVAFMYTAGKNSNIIVNASRYHDLIFWNSTTAVEDWTQY